MGNLIIYKYNAYKVKLDSKRIKGMRLLKSCALSSFAFFSIIPIYILDLELME